MSTQTFFCFVFLSISVYSTFADTQGCHFQAFPPTPFYPNLHNNGTLFEYVPATYIHKMQQLVDSVSKMILRDFPPDYKGEFEPFIYWGTAGRAAMSLRFFTQTNNKEWLFKAKDYIDYALATTKPYNYTGFTFAFQKGRTGIASVAAVIYDLLGNNATMVQQMIEEVNWVFDQVKEGDYYDFESGMAGLVYAGDYLNQYFKTAVIPESKIRRILLLIYQAGMKYYNATTGAMQFEYYDNHFYTGMGSHGSGSPIYCLLQHMDLIQNDTIANHVFSTIDYYTSIQTKSGQIPGDLQPDRTQWCHGIPGILPVFGLAYAKTKKQKYFDAGILGCELVAQIGILAKGMQFCHGVGGNIYMVLDFYKQTMDTRIRSMAISMLMSALDTPQLTDPSMWESYDCLPDGMFVSSPIGMVLLFSDVIQNNYHLENVKMLAFHL